MFINCTNHPSASWGEKQTNEAKKYGEIRDMLFLNISPQMTIQELMKLGKEHGDNIRQQYNDQKIAPQFL